MCQGPKIPFFFFIDLTWNHPILLYSHMQNCHKEGVHAPGPRLIVAPSEVKRFLRPFFRREGTNLGPEKCRTRIYSRLLYLL